MKMLLIISSTAEVNVPHCVMFVPDEYDRERALREASWHGSIAEPEIIAVVDLPVAQIARMVDLVYDYDIYAKEIVY